MSEHTFDIDIEIGGYEYPLSVTGHYTPPCKGARERGTGVPLEPDSQEEVEITKVEIKDSTGKWVEFPYLEALDADLQDKWLDEFKGLGGL